MTLGPSQVEATVDVAPFDLRPEAGTETGSVALCLHGLTGTPYEVRPVAEALVSRGVRAVGIWMAGHNGTVDDLAATRHEEWVELARTELASLRAEHECVYLVGVSLGGLVSLRLAETERIEGIVTVGAPLQLAPPIPLLIPLLRLIRKSRPKKPSGLADPEALARHPRFPAMPFNAVFELIRLQKKVIPDLARIDAPILVAHGALDQTVRPRDARRLFESVGTDSGRKRLMLLERSAHVAAVDYDGAEFAETAAAFLLAQT